LPGITGLAALVWLTWLVRSDPVGQDVTQTPSTPLPPAVPGPFSMVRRRPALILAGMLAIWLVVKIGFVHWVLPERTNERQPRAKGLEIASLVPAERPLYLFRLKDEGIMFYFGRSVRRLDGPEQLPSSAEPLYCMLLESEWLHWPDPQHTEVILRLQDQQKAPILLIKVEPSPLPLASRQLDIGESPMNP
jgi:hypothetical protein